MLLGPVKFLTLIATALVASVQGQNCAKITVRKEGTNLMQYFKTYNLISITTVHDMTAAEVRVYRDTIRMAIRTPDPDVRGSSIWQAAADLHNANAAIIHNGAPFLYWHRLFLWSMEQKLQRLNPDFFFPYWDTSVNNEYLAGRWSQSVAITMSDISDTSIQNNRRLNANTDQVSPSQWRAVLQQSIDNGQGVSAIIPSGFKSDFFYSLVQLLCPFSSN